MLELKADDVVTENHKAPEKEIRTEGGLEKKEGKVQAKPVASKVPVEPYKLNILFP